MKIKFIYFAIIVLIFSQTQNAQAQYISTVVGNGIDSFAGDNGPATAAMCGWVARVAVDTNGNIYFGDYSNSRIRKISGVTGIVTTVAGNGTAGYGGDGFAATLAELNGTQGLAVDNKGNLYIADAFNNRIRKVDTAGIITTIAGTGSGGALGDSGQATNAAIIQAMGVAVDKIGNVYIADYFNHRIRKVDTTGIITTIAGTGTAGHTGDGGLPILAELNYPIDVCLDTLGNIYVSDFGNYCIRKIIPEGNIITIAGNTTAGYFGDNGPATNAEFNNVEGIAADNWGNVYVADGENSRVRKIDPTGIITTYAGNGTAMYNGDGILATLAALHVPDGVAIDKFGNLYIGDNENDRVRKVTPPPTTTHLQVSEIVTEIYPNPVYTHDEVLISVKTQHAIPAEIKIINTLGLCVKTITTTTNNPIYIKADLPSGCYFITITTNAGTKEIPIVVLY